MGVCCGRCGAKERIELQYITPGYTGISLLQVLFIRTTCPHKSSVFRDWTAESDPAFRVSTTPEGLKSSSPPGWKIQIRSELTCKQGLATRKCPTARHLSCPARAGYGQKWSPGRRTHPSHCWPFSHSPSRSYRHIPLVKKGKSSIQPMKFWLSAYNRLRPRKWHGCHGPKLWAPESVEVRSGILRRDTGHLGDGMQLSVLGGKARLAFVANCVSGMVRPCSSKKLCRAGCGL